MGVAGGMRGKIKVTAKQCHVYGQNSDAWRQAKTGMK